MKRLVCEMCGGSDLVKQDGVFVCQNCGTKYSVEEAKKMMVEGAVTVEGTVAVEGTVKVDKSEQLKKLYILAERARKSNNSDNAVRYYNEIMYEDPNSWEANFYLVYFKAKNTNIGSIPSVCYDLINNYPSTFELLGQEKGEDIVTELNMLLDDIKRYCFTIINSTRGMQEECMYWSKALDCLSSYGDKLVESYGDKYKDVAIRAWKETIDLYLQIMNSCESAGLAESTANIISFYFDITAVVTKIYNFDCSYEDPWGITKDLRKNEKFIICPKCGTKMRDRENKCPQCGTPKEEIQRLIKEQAEREAAERERIRKERAEKEAEEARVRAEKRKAWWQKNWKKVLFAFSVLVLLLIIAISILKIIERQQYKQALAEAQAYIAAGDSCVAIAQYDKAQGFYDKAHMLTQDKSTRDTIQQKSKQIKRLKSEAEKKELEKKKQSEIIKRQSANDSGANKTTDQSKNVNLKKLKTKKGVCEIPKGVKSIKPRTFEYREDIEKVILPEGLTIIGASAFEGCRNLKVIEFPNSLIRIEKDAFLFCHSLSSIIIPKNVKEIGEGVFSSCGLKSISLPQNIKIGEGAFYNCDKLTSITLPKGITIIREQTFAECYELTSVSIPEGVETIEYWAFYNSHDLNSITIPLSVTQIGDEAFKYCKSIKIPERWRGTKAVEGCRNVIYY